MAKKANVKPPRPRPKRRELPDPRTVVEEIEGFMPDGTRVTVLRTTQQDEYEEAPSKKVK
jgi:hypothetical protein